VDESEQILIRIPKAHATTYSTFKVGCRTAHIERQHTLIGIPDIDHAIGVLVRRGHLHFAEQFSPLIT
jgi:hypothetical protein